MFLIAKSWTERNRRFYCAERNRRFGCPERNRRSYCSAEGPASLQEVCQGRGLQSWAFHSDVPFSVPWPRQGRKGKAISQHCLRSEWSAQWTYLLERVKLHGEAIASNSSQQELLDFKCLKCDFVTTHAPALTVHMKMKHPCEEPKEKHPTLKLGLTSSTSSGSTSQTDSSTKSSSSVQSATDSSAREGDSAVAVDSSDPVRVSSTFQAAVRLTVQRVKVTSLRILAIRCL